MKHLIRDGKAVTIIITVMFVITKAVRKMEVNRSDGGWWWLIAISKLSDSNWNMYENVKQKHENYKIYS